MNKEQRGSQQPSLRFTKALKNVQIVLRRLISRTVRRTVRLELCRAAQWCGRACYKLRATGKTDRSRFSA